MLYPKTAGEKCVVSGVVVINSAITPLPGNGSVEIVLALSALCADALLYTVTHAPADT